MTIATAAAWLYAVMASLLFGASIYETVVVHPAWSRKPPESFAAFMGEPVGRMNIAAFWIPVAPLFALSSLVALGTAYSNGTLGAPIITSSICAVAVVSWTLAYFRPTVSRFLEQGGGGASADRLRSEARLWIRLNVVRTTLVMIAWWGALATLASPS